MDSEWIGAAIAIAAGVIIGTIAGRGVLRLLSDERRPEALREAASPIGSFVFSVFLVIGLMVALGFVNSESLDQMDDDLVDYLPKILSAAILLILGNVAASFAAVAISQALGRASGRAQRQVPIVVRFAIMALAAILAASQLGIDTTIINIAVAAVLFGSALAAALIAGLGSRSVSADIAAGRALRTLVTPGDRLSIDNGTATVSGTVVAVRSVMVELSDEHDTAHMVPNSHVLDSRLTVERASTTDPTEQ